MSAPTRGYILPIWANADAYRATAHAYMKREGVTEVSNRDGNTYSIDQIEKSLTGFKNQTNEQAIK